MYSSADGSNVFVFVSIVIVIVWLSMASIPIPGVRRGEGCFDKVVGQNFPLFFTGQSTHSTKLSP